MQENVFNILILDPANGDMSGNLESSVIDVSRISSVVFFALYTGAPVGELKIQVSVDGINYVDLPDSPVAITAAGQYMWNVTDTNYDKMKMVYTATSGSGTLSIQANGKGF